MILTGSEIKKQIKKGNIEIHPFNESNLAPNSYDLRLHDELLVRIPNSPILDVKNKTQTEIHHIECDGYILQPGRLYLGRTEESTFSKTFVPMIEGRSSIGRLGISIHATAGFGDIGFFGYWTLEISCIEPVRIYPGIRICQIFYHTVKGKIIHYHGKYQDNDGIQASQSYLDSI